ncbi:MAG: Gp19/Gp15/Gp42 family protein [Actinomycetaceae bacterium]|nr:Gp19/Gp15/Gp42 family protein [Actinomycetaceae bacterium]MDY5273652.1 Gp19/Gp15/Gp42 family protein [Arcanobacterium sp.]
MDAPFATVQNLESRWRKLTDAESAQAEVLIADASDLIKVECPRWNTANDATLTRVTCAIVKRAMSKPLGIEAAQGASSASMTAGPYSQQLSFSNPAGDLYLTKAEARSLGGRATRAYEYNPLLRKEAP